MDDFITGLLAWAAFGTWWEHWQFRWVEPSEIDPRARAIQDFVFCLPLPLFMTLNAAHAARLRAH